MLIGYRLVDILVETVVAADMALTTGNLQLLVVALEAVLLL
jgi:hypothetical protein